MKPNTSFTLDINDINIIENALRQQISKLSERRLTHVQSTIVPETALESVKEIDSKISELNDLLGRIHNQKNWYRPKDKIYISG